jgi:hypothetical protein
VGRERNRVTALKVTPHNRGATRLILSILALLTEDGRRNNMLKPTLENSGLAMLQELAQADLLEPALFEPYYFKFEVTTAAVPILERFLESPIKENRRHALIALVRCTTAVGYALDAFMLHMQGVFYREDIDDQVGADILTLLAARGCRLARKILLVLIYDQNWVESYFEGFLVFKAQHLGSSSLEELYDAYMSEIAATWPLVRGPLSTDSK